MCVCVCVRTGHEGRVWAVAWAAGEAGAAGGAEELDESRLLTAGQDGRLIILEADQGIRVCVHNLHQPIRCVRMYTWCT